MSDNFKELALKEKTQKAYPEFTDAVDGLAVEELKSNLTRYAKYREETEMAKKKDEELEEAQERVKFLIGPYNDTLKALKMKTAYINILMDEQAQQNGEEKEA